MMAKRPDRILTISRACSVPVFLAARRHADLLLRPTRMRNIFALSPHDEHYQAKVQEALVDDLYRRALFPVFLSFAMLYVLYLALADTVLRRPIIGWILAAAFALSIPRLASILFVDRIRARYPDPRIRIAIFAIGAMMLGGSMAAINIIAAPIVTSEQLALLAIVSAGANSFAIITMSSSLISYLLYMVPNIASVVVAVLIGPKLEHGGILLFLCVINLFGLMFMATFVHMKGRRSILLGLHIDESNVTLQQVNSQLTSEIAERLVIEHALEQRNSELETLNQKLASAQSQLLQSEKMASVGQLAAGVAHEINTPIAFVHSNFNSLGTYVKDIVSLLDAYQEVERAPDNQGAAHRQLEQLKRTINVSFLREDIPMLLNESAEGLSRVQRIVKDLKEFSHPDETEWQCVDIHQGLESTLNVAAHQIRSKANVEREYAKLPSIQCLPAQINQVFLNLLINAAQAHQERGTITVSTGHDEDSIWVRIADTGKGIEPAHLGRIFDPFFTTKAIGVGPGLGLSVSYGIVQMHGGTIEVNSQVGRGSAFTVRLPIKGKRGS
jgi:signal transduction histidine kinase